MQRVAQMPDWAQRDRLHDMAWINENMHVLWPASQQQHRERGRGAIVVDTTVQPVPGGGHPFAYYDEGQSQAFGDSDAVRMVSKYNPACEVVVLLLKQQRRLSVYQVQLPYMGKPQS